MTERREESVICGGCADDCAARRIRWCCGKPFCLRCYERHLDECHTSQR